MAAMNGAAGDWPGMVGTPFIFLNDTFNNTVHTATRFYFHKKAQRMLR